MPPPPPPPPPPIVFPFSSKKPRRRLSWSDKSNFPTNSQHSTLPTSQAESVTFHSDSELYDEVPELVTPRSSKDKSPFKLRERSITMPKKPPSPSKWGYGWGMTRPKEIVDDDDDDDDSILPVYPTVVMRESRSTKASRSTQGAARSRASKPRPPILGHLEHHESTSTLVGSAFERKVNDGYEYSIRDTTERLNEMRQLMAKDNLDYYVVPAEDAHGSEHVAASDKRCEFISGFAGPDGHAIITKNSAYLFTDARYWAPAANQIDNNWTLIRTGSPGAPQDWIEWLVDRVKDSIIGIDSRMISVEKASLLRSKIFAKNSKFFFPPQNLVDIIWRDKPTKSLEKVYLQSIEFTGKDASSKLSKLREWIRQQPPDVSQPNNVIGPPVATLIASLPCVAYVLNLRGSDIPYSPLFHAYLFVALDRAILFVEPQKVDPEVTDYLASIGVELRGYTDLWAFLRRREWGSDRILLTPQTSYTIALMLNTSLYTVAPSYVEHHMMSIKNETEIEGMKRAYLREGLSFVRFLSWLEAKIAGGMDISEYEAASRLTEFRRKNKNFVGLAYEAISASGSNAGVPSYSPKKSSCAIISRDTPYMIDSGGQYYDGTCDTTRTLHFGHPTPEMCEAYTRVLQGHIAIDSAIFPEGTSGRQLDVLARRALWKDGLDYMHGTGHGVGAFLTVHEGPHGFASNVPLVPGHVITNEPGFYLEGQWGMRIESTLVVRRVKTKGEFNGDIWLGFERLTCVPIQLCMVRENMLSKEEKMWVKEHNQRCYEKISPFLKDDKVALKWLKREVERDIGLPGSTWKK